MILESTLKSKLLLAAPVKLPLMRLFVRNTGVAQFGDRKVSFSITGQCDIAGYIRGGRVIEIELKSEKGTLEPEQEVWRDWCLSWNIPWICLQARKAESADETVSRWCEELGRATACL
jgi:hypothetical protein